MALHMIEAPQLQADVRSIRARVERCADRILDAAQLAPGMRLADIGTGEGIIAFRAIRRIGSTLDVLLTDDSEHLLQQAASLAFQHQAHSQCAFLHCPADQLDGIADGSVDVITARDVLAYVTDKSAALREFHRILRRGGRISLAEAVLQDDAHCSERTLFHLARRAGFVDIHLELHIDVLPASRIIYLSGVVATSDRM